MLVSIDDVDGWENMAYYEIKFQDVFENTIGHIDKTQGQCHFHLCRLRPGRKQTARGPEHFRNLAGCIGNATAGADYRNDILNR